MKTTYKKISEAAEMKEMNGTLEQSETISSQILLGIGLRIFGFVEASEK